MWEVEYPRAESIKPPAIAQEHPSDLIKSRRLGSRGLQRGADLANCQLGRLIDVAGREAQDAEAGVDEGVLAPVVLHQSVAVVSAVEFDDQTGAGVVEVGAGDGPTICVGKRDLDLGPRHSPSQQEPPQSRLHRGLGRLGDCEQPTEPPGPG